MIPRRIYILTPRWSATAVPASPLPRVCGWFALNTGYEWLKWQPPTDPFTLANFRLLMYESQRTIIARITDMFQLRFACALILGFLGELLTGALLSWFADGPVGLILGNTTRCVCWFAAIPGRTNPARNSPPTD